MTPPSTTPAVPTNELSRLFNQALGDHEVVISRDNAAQLINQVQEALLPGHHDKVIRLPEVSHHHKAAIFIAAQDGKAGISREDIAATMVRHANIRFDPNYSVRELWKDAGLKALSPSRNPQGRRKYMAAVRQAIREFDAGNWREARALFRKAHGIHPNARTHRGLGMCAFELKQYVDAIPHFRASLVEPKLALTPTQRVHVADLLDQSRAFTGHYRVLVSPDSARVSIDGTDLQTDQHGTVVLEVGQYEIRVEAEDYRPMVRQITVRGGEDEDLKLSLQPVDKTVVEQKRQDEAEEAAVAEVWAIREDMRLTTHLSLRYFYYGDNFGIQETFFDGGETGHKNYRNPETGDPAFAFGLGLRYAATPRIEIPVRLMFQIGPDQGTTDCGIDLEGLAGGGRQCESSHFMLAAQTTFRFRPVSATSSWYVGAGILAGVSFVSATVADSAGDRLEDSWVLPTFGGVGETGFVFGNNEQYEVSLQGAGGILGEGAMGFAELSLGYAVL